MKVTSSKMTKVEITDVLCLDPVMVFLEDLGPRRGRVTITCFDQAWTASWGGMSESCVADFFCSCDEHYLARKLSSRMAPAVPDMDGLADYTRGYILRERKRGNFSRGEARNLFDEAGVLDGYPSIEALWCGPTSYLTNVYGGDWWDVMPYKPNHEYEYLCRIVKTIQDALVEASTEVAA